MKFSYVAQRAVKTTFGPGTTSPVRATRALAQMTLGASMVVACGEAAETPPFSVDMAAASNSTSGTSPAAPGTVPSQPNPVVPTATIAPGPSDTPNTSQPTSSNVSPTTITPTPSVTATGSTATEAPSSSTGENLTSIPETDSTNAPTSSTGTGEPTGPEQPVGGIGELADLPCGARYTALGGGGWRFCLRLDDGTGACAQAEGSAVFERVTLTGGGALDNVAQITGAGDGAPLLVATTSGALLGGTFPAGVNPTPLVASGVVNVTGGLNPRVALVRESGGFGILSWKGTEQPAPLALPDGARPVQVAANYGLACALDTQGDVYCWDMGGNHQVPGVTGTPSKMDFAEPSRMVTVGQNSVCALTFDGVIQCAAHYYSSPWLPAKTENGQPTLDASLYEPARDITAGYHQGIIVKADGTAYFFGDNGSQTNNHGQLFAGASDVVASGGDRKNACVMTSGGDVYCWSNGASVQATLGGQPLKAATAPCSP